jgi:hypothetical protein
MEKSEIAKLTAAVERVGDLIEDQNRPSPLMGPEAQALTLLGKDPDKFAEARHRREMQDLAEEEARSAKLAARWSAVAALAALATAGVSAFR